MSDTISRLLVARLNHHSEYLDELLRARENAKTQLRQYDREIAWMRERMMVLGLCIRAFRRCPKRPAD